MIRTNSERCSLIKGQGQLSANLSGQLELAGRGKGWRMMNNDFVMSDRNYLFFFDCRHYITK